MVEVPGAIPVTDPVDEPILTADVFTEVQTPPPIASLKVMLPEGQMGALPVIIPAFAEVVTARIVVAAALPQLFVMV